MNKMIKTWIISVISALLLCTIISTAAFAQVPKKINYQGYLEDKNTDLPVNGMKTLEFAIYDAPTGGNQVWTEPAKIVQVDKGKFSVHLGETNPIDLPKAQPYYLEVKVDGQILKDSMGNEREELTSALYALLVDGVTLRNGDTLVGVRAGESLTTGGNNTLVGWEAGTANDTGAGNTFIGTGAGRNNTTGWWNTFVGIWTGADHTEGNFNTFVGHYAGNNNITGRDNTFIGQAAGADATGNGNIFIGQQAGRYETGSNKLYIHNSGTDKPLIYGELDNRIAAINGNLGIGTTEPAFQVSLGASTANTKLALYETGADNSYGLGVVPGAFRFHLNGRGANFIFFDSDEADANEIFTIQGKGNVGIGTTNPPAKLTVRGNVLIQSENDGTNLIELGEGLDYAEGFDVAGSTAIEPGTVLSIDPDNPGELAVSSSSYDTKVAGIVAGANGMGSGVRLGADQFDYDVALAGRAYCNVDATYGEVSPGDLLTTSPTPGYAMVVKDRANAQGAILGKAMEQLPQGKKGQILVLVTLQ